MRRFFTGAEYYKCLICEKEIESEIAISNLLCTYKHLCLECYHKLGPINRYEVFEGYNILYLYTYTDFTRNIIYRYKGQYDYALKDIFFSKHNHLLKKYRGYKIVCAPSNEAEDNLRGFNHIVEIARTIDLEILDILYKTKEYKQSNMKGNQRLGIKKVIASRNLELVEGKKILLIDDVVTSGNTLRACIDCLKEGNPQCIDIIVAAKR